MIHTLKLNNFRSYSDGLFGFEPGVNIVVGPNASGKTNLLQALHTIAVGGGFRLSEKDMIALGTDWCRLEALTDDGSRVIKLTRESSKIIELDGVVKHRLSARTALPVVVFEPDHMLLLANEPDRRRAFVDGILSFSEPGYAGLLRDYKRILAQRNRLLKQPNCSADAMFVWDVQLCQKAGTIVALRTMMLGQLNERIKDAYQKISNKPELLELHYLSKITHAHYANELSTYLRLHFNDDLARGFTTAGPHRDDIGIELQGRDARVTASRGETRSIILALKIAELQLLHDTTGVAPILLLDDVFSELDGSRRRNLAASLREYQTFLTTTDADVAVDHFSDYNIIPMG